nr:hypothetical protein [Lujinxingiaceae bacterium]
VLGNPQAFGQVFNVADNSALSVGEVLTSIAEAYGLDLGPSVPFPNATIWALLTPFIDNDSAFDMVRQIMRQLWRRVQARHGISSPLRPRVDRSALFYVGDDSIVVASALQALGWKPQWPDFRHGIIDTVRWYQEHGWVPRIDRDSQVKMRDANKQRGIAYNEQLQGVATLVGEGNQALSLALKFEWPTIPRLLAVTEGHINGKITIDRVVENATIEGIATVRLFPPFEMNYEFGFVDAAQSAFRFIGKRHLRGPMPLQSISRLDGHIINRRGECVATAAAEIAAMGEAVPLRSDLRKLTPV